MKVKNQLYENNAVDGQVNRNYHSNSAENDPELRLTQKPRPSFQLIWQNVSRQVKVKNGFLSSTKTILEPMNGVIEGGTITALMGPSGAGKTTLLKIIADKISCSSSTGVEGQAFVRHNLSLQEAKSFRIGYVPQDDQLFTEFTIKETFMFASKMTNGQLNRKAHDSAVKEILKKLDLTEKANTVIHKLSGGQVKRASIGVELMAFPEILILDEPTSGLDSDTAEKVVSLLRNLVQKPLHLDENPAVLCTIHQPSRDVFYSFDNIFLLSRTGQNIYYGTPQGVKTYLSNHGYSSNRNTNPAEYMIEFANGKHGKEAFNGMSCQTYEKTMSAIINNKKTMSCRRFSPVNEVAVSDLRMKTSTSFFFQVFLLFQRSFLKHTTKSVGTLLKVICGLLIGILLFNMSKKPFGEVTGCWNTFKILTTPENVVNVTRGRSSLAKLSNMDNFNFDLLGMAKSIKEGSVFTYLTIQYEMMFFASTLVFAFPLEIQTHFKEMSNSWYSPLALMVSKSLANAATHVIASIPMFIYAYWVSEQPMDYWVRPVIAFGVVYTLGIIWETKAEIVCLLFSRFPQPMSIAFTVAMFYPALVFSGFSVRNVDMWFIIKPLSRINDLTNAFEATMIATFGLGRCFNIQNNSMVRVQAEQINLKSIVKTMWSSFGSNDTETFSALLGQPREHLNLVVEAFTDFLNWPSNSSSNIEIRKSDSFMLDFFEVQETTFLFNIMNLVTTLFVCKLLVYVILKMQVSYKL